MRKLTTVLALAALPAALIVLPAQADTVPGGAEGCVATPGPAGPTVLYTGTCTLDATRNGGYATGGSGWTVDVYRGHDVNGNWILHKHYAGGSSPSACTTAILPGDHVVATVTDTQSGAAIGNPFPAGSPDLPGNPPGTDC